MKQETIFSDSEANAWFDRNKYALKNKDFSDDLIVKEIISINNEVDETIEMPKNGLKLLEIGCGNAGRLKYLENTIKLQCHGIEPSKKAASEANANGIAVKVGTAEKLDFEDKYFDIIVYGFCLYLCDRDDLFKITKEANRVLKKKGFIIIMDFYNPWKNKKNKYIHKDGVFSYKMDYKELFLWHPFYECYNHKLVHHSNLSITDIEDEWISISTLRKNESFFNE